MSFPDSNQPQTNKEALEAFREAFTRPPIVRRSFVTNLNVERNVFEENAKPLFEQIQGERGYDKITVRNHWEFSIEERPGGLLVPKGKVTNILRMMRSGNSQYPNAVIELVPPRDTRPAEFMVGHQRNDENPTVYEDLRQEIEAVMPKVAHVFGIKGCQGMMLRYRNRIAQSRYNNLWKNPHRVTLSDVFKIFGSGTHGHTFQVPFRIEFSEQSPSMGDFSLPDPRATVAYLATAEATEQKNEFAFDVVLTYSTLQSKLIYSEKDFWPALDWAHNMVLWSFKESFSEKAIQEFQA
ncbi:MAG: hypothetical protein WD708_11355 [Kiritimatiellia bacterium]